MQNIFKQNVTISCTLIFYDYNLHKKNYGRVRNIESFWVRESIQGHR